MRLNIIFLAILFMISGCAYKSATYEQFERSRNIHIGYSLIPNANKKNREIYSENKYIYKMERPKNCIYGYLTNRDGNPEKVIGWIIISGKEYCKEQPRMGEMI